MKVKAFNPWTEGDEALLLGMFGQNRTYAYMAMVLKRSELALQARLLRLGKITPEQMGLSKVA